MLALVLVSLVVRRGLAQHAIQHVFGPKIGDERLQCGAQRHGTERDQRQISRRYEMHEGLGGGTSIGPRIAQQQDNTKQSVMA